MFNAINVLCHIQSLGLPLVFKNCVGKITGDYDSSYYFEFWSTDRASVRGLIEHLLCCHALNQWEADYIFDHFDC